MPSYLVLVNPGAGSVDDGVDAADSWRRDDDLVAVHDELSQHGEVTMAVVEGDDAVRSTVGSAAEDTVLVVVGGDGTLHRFANLLHPMTHPVLLLPGGTGNDFAGGLDLPEDLVEAAALAGTGVVRRVDLMEVAGVRATNAAHLGIGVDAAEAAAGMKGLLGKLAYPAGAVRAATGFRPRTVTLTVDGTVVVDTAPVAMFGIFNGRRVGGGTVMCPPADPTDGLLDLVVLEADTKAALTATTAAVVRGTHLEREDVLHVRGRQVEVLLHEDDVASWNIDGELMDLPCQTTVEVLPGAWQLHTPGPSDLR